MEKIALITGASRGIGRATALKFNKLGYKVIGTYNHSFSLAKELENLGIDMVKTNVSNVTEIESLFDYVIKKYGKIDVLINNAGISTTPKFILDVKTEEINSLIDVNLKGLIYATQHAIKYMLSKGGKILNVSSVFGLDGGSCEAVYSASKAGIIGFTNAVAKELEESNLQISTVLLGLIDTDMNSHLSYEEKFNFVSSYGLKKIPTPSSVANRLLKIINLDNVNGKTFKIFVGSTKN